MKPHRTDSVSLFFGLVFVLVALGYLAKVYLRLNLPSMGWFLAGGLIFLGAVGAITALVPHKRERQSPEYAQVVNQSAVQYEQESEPRQPEPEGWQPGYQPGRPESGGWQPEPEGWQPGYQPGRTESEGGPEPGRETGQERGTGDAAAEQAR